MLPLVKVLMPPREQLMPALEQVLYSGMIAEGESVYAFERRFAEVFGLPMALGMSSGTAALHLSLALAGVGPGDEVISTAMTAEPTNICIAQVGGTVVWGDVDPDTGNLCPQSVRERLTDRTKAIMVVHYAGYPVDLAPILAIAAERGIPVIEDCAHALGARYAGQPIGTLADYAIYSLQAIKHMTTVDGGVWTCRDPDKVPAAKRFRWFGMEKGKPRTELDIDAVGYKYNMHNVAGVIGLAQLDGISAKIDRHIDNGRFFDRELAQVAGVRPAPLPTGSEPSYWLYTMLCDDTDTVEKALTAQGIAASKLHKRNDLHSLFKASRRELPGLDRFYTQLLHIPCGWWVSDEDREKIVSILRRG
jgi:perosamine synthetase